MGKISSGIDKLDALIDSFHIGDNVIWEVEAGTSHPHFVRQFVRQALAENRKTIFISFNHSPQSIFSRYCNEMSENFVLLDCFTSGKGKDDKTFAQYYDGTVPGSVIRIYRPADIELFTQRLNEIEDSLPKGACYVFDSLTGMQDLWGSEEKTYKFFTYMCPRLFDRETVAYWLMEKGAHTSNFKANLRHITQVVLELSKGSDNLYIKALKLDGRQDREAFKSQQYRISDNSVLFLPSHKEAVSDIDIGSKIRQYRLQNEMSQKELADKVGLSASSISQLESNQISPTMNNFILICNALRVSPAQFWAVPKEPKWVIRAPKLQAGQSVEMFKAGKVSGHAWAIEPGDTVKGMSEASALLLVMKGTLSVSAGKESQTLYDGDAAMLEKGKKSAWKNVGATQAQVLRISY